MNRQVSFHAMAEQELNDAASYYKGTLKNRCFHHSRASNPLIIHTLR